MSTKNTILEWRSAGLSFAGASWLFQRLSAAALLGLVLVHAHFIQRSFISSGAMTYGDLMAVLSRPFVKAIELCLFFFGTLHLINGLWSVVTTFFRESTLRGWMMAAAVVAGVLFFCTVSAVILPL